jgi:type IV pilus biogenesis protein CpaD/CtpE
VVQLGASNRPPCSSEAHGDYVYANPIGVLVTRTMTDADREARVQVLERLRAAEPD